MKQYEIMTITQLGLGEDGSTDVLNQIKDLITQHGGRILNHDIWGKRKFAYPIKHETEGYYNVITFELSASKLPEFKNILNLREDLLRYLITSAEK